MGRPEKMAQIMRDYCADDSHGYSQVNRWGPDFDCSSLVYTCANAAGYNVPTGSGYTGTMIDDFTNAGFQCLPFDGDFSTDPVGTIMLTPGSHTEMELGGCFGGAHCDENGGASGANCGDQTGQEVSLCARYNYPWEYVLIPPECVDGADTSTETPATGATADIDSVAQDVIDGRYGVGADRKQRLAAAGYDYQTVQARVNVILHEAESASFGYDVDVIANKVIEGEYGNGDDRKQRLAAAGYDYATVQARVNQLLA